jgi:cytochrome c oxidase subunit II
VTRPAGRMPGITIAVMVVTVTTTACTSSFGMPEGATEQGRDIRDLWVSFVVIAIAVAGLVYGLIAWALVRYRRRRDDDPDALGVQTHANIPLEIVYTSVPVLIVIGLFALSFRTEQRVNEVVPEPAVTVEATAFAWGWRFAYPDQGVEIVSPPSSPAEPGPELVLPLGEPTRIVLGANDVIHAFWVPEFNFKRDAVPGRINVFDLTPNRTGVFRGVCAEFCGLNHAFMTFTVRIVEPAEFDAWATAAGAAQGEEAAA